MHAWNFMMHQSPCIWRQIHLAWDLELVCCRYETAWTAGMMKLHLMQPSIQLLLSVNSIKCRVMVQQHWERSTLYTTRAQKVPSLCFLKEVHVITDHKQLVAMISKDVAMSLHLWCIMLYINQYSVHILYKPGPELYIADWLSCHNHVEDQDQEITNMNVRIHTINTAVNVNICTSVENIKAITEGVEL